MAKKAQKAQNAELPTSVRLSAELSKMLDAKIERLRRSQPHLRLTRSNALKMAVYEFAKYDHVDPSGRVIGADEAFARSIPITRGGAEIDARPGNPWSFDLPCRMIDPGASSITQLVTLVSLFRAELIEISYAGGGATASAPPVAVSELAAVRDHVKVDSTAPVSGRPVGITYKDGIASCNVMFQRGDEIVLSLHSSAKDPVCCNIKISGRCAP